MADVAVVAHAGKNLGGGLLELRRALARQGVTDPVWHEVSKSRQAPRYARRAAAGGADVVFVWGGDGTVQRCIDALAGTGTPLQWARAFGRIALGHPERSPFAKVTLGKKFTIRFDRKTPFELDGGARPASRKLRIKAHPGSVAICVPASD